MRQGQERVARLFERTLNQLCASPGAVPGEMILWLLMVWRTSALRQADDQQFDDWLHEVVGAIRLTSWEQAKGVLKSAVWIDAIHDPRGKQVLNEILGS